MAPSANPPPLSPNARWPDGLSIRSITPADAHGIAALHNQPGFRFGTMRLPYQTVAEVEKMIGNTAAGNLWLVAEIDGRIVGDSGLFRFNGRRTHVGVLGIGVHDAWVGRGIGQALLGEVLVVADDWLNLRRIELTVFADNHRAIGLYERNGFVHEGCHRDYAFRDGQYADCKAMARLRTGGHCPS